MTGALGLVFVGGGWVAYLIGSLRGCRSLTRVGFVCMLLGVLGVVAARLGP